MAKRVAAAGPVEGPWALPDGWRWERLGSFLSKGGTSVTPARTPDELFQVYSVPSHPTGYPESLAGQEIGSSKQTVAINDVLLCKINPRINRVWKVMDRGTGRLIASTEWIRFGADEGVNPDYLRYFLMRQELRDYLAMNASGVGGSLMRVRPAVVEPVPFPLAPKDQQSRIVARIHELFAEIDDGEAALARARDDLATWRKALLKAAVTGELTADWRAASPSTETAADLLACILAARPQTAPRKRGAADHNASADVEPSLPSGWAHASFDQLYDVLSDNGMKVKERDYKAVGRFPVIDQGAKAIAGYTDDAAMVRDPERPWILFGDHTRRFKFVDHPFCVGADGIKIMRPVRQIDPTFAFRCLQAAHFEDRGYSRHFQFVRALSFPLPPLQEQRRIVLVIEEALAAGQEINSGCEDLYKGSTTLRQSILAAAFRGELA